MEVVFDEEEFNCYMCEVVQVEFDYLVLIDQYFENVVEVDVDVFCDYIGVVIVGGLMEYIELVGIYFGDLVCCLFVVFFGEVVLNMICDWSCFLV